MKFEATIMGFEGLKSILWSQRMVCEKLIFGKNQLQTIISALENIK